MDIQNTLTDPVRCVQEFLQAHYDGQSPLLLGYSGGPDSKTLLYALLACGVKNLHLAHVDHGWRETSAREAENLQKEADHLQCPFHSIRLIPSQKGNKENAAREERLSFFHSLFHRFSFQALLLAHQAGDLAETVLKRIFEGAHLPFIGGMDGVGSHQGMPIWRPFLNLERIKIVEFLKERNLEPIFDATNFDPVYLRARMRSEIFPFLNQTFGKKIEANLNLLSHRCSELRDYLDRKIEPVFRQIEKASWGFRVDTCGMERIERRHLIQKLARTEHFSLPRTILEPLLDALEELSLMRKFQSDAGDLICEKGKFLFLRKTGQNFLPEAFKREKKG